MMSGFSLNICAPTPRKLVGASEDTKEAVVGGALAFVKVNRATLSVSTEAISQEEVATWKLEEVCPSNWTGQPYPSLLRGTAT